MITTTGEHLSLHSHTHTKKEIQSAKKLLFFFCPRAAAAAAEMLDAIQSILS